MKSLVSTTRARFAAAGFALSVITACGQKSAPWDTYPGIDGHAAYLPLRGTAHDPTGLSSATSCEGCHPGTSFRDFVCVSCHTAAQTDPIHVSSVASGYVPGAVTSADCYRCHPDGQGMSAAAHGPFFPIDTASHPALCQTCHNDPTARTDPTKLACVSCHQTRPGFSTAHSRVRDYPVSVTAPWCLRCHADSQVDTIAGHGRQTAAGGPRGGGGPGDGNHDTRCFTCHTMVPPYFGGTAGGVAGRPWAQSWSQAACGSCH